FLVSLGRFDEGILAGRHAVGLDPLSRSSYDAFGFALYFARRYREALLAYGESLPPDPSYPEAHGHRRLAYHAVDLLPRARSSCETKPEFFLSQLCLAVVYDRLGRHPDAEAVLAKMKAALGDAVAYQYAEIYAQWGSRTSALDWLATALRL